ncbi:uncharacterized protein METZ01_LOCUS228231 [marine metagenome]|uniref:Uncharacterized protein n=1 Tax=marine metagenome TaxID=408172 RepID=A0A382GL83_9ZZZZ
MPLLPENNPFVPNPKTWWCYRCKAHSNYRHYRTNISSGDGTNTSYEKYACKVCNASMFTPDQTSPWMKGFLGVAFVLLLIGGLANYSGFGRSERQALDMICLGFGGFCGLFGGIMYYYQRKWYAWVSCQNKKSPEDLILEAKEFESKGE